MHASPRLLLWVIIVVSLAGCGPTTSVPILTAATAVLPQTVAPTSGGAVATTPSARPPSAVMPTMAPQATTPPSVMAVDLPDGRGGVGFDDLRYDATLGQVLAPGGRTGNVDLVDPATQAVMPIAGFSAQPRFSGGHDDGPTSAGSESPANHKRLRGGAVTADSVRCLPPSSAMSTLNSSIFVYRRWCWRWW